VISIREAVSKDARALSHEEIPGGLDRSLVMIETGLTVRLTGELEEMQHFLTTGAKDGSTIPSLLQIAVRVGIGEGGILYAFVEMIVAKLIEDLEAGAQTIVTTPGVDWKAATAHRSGPARENGKPRSGAQAQRPVAQLHFDPRFLGRGGAGGEIPIGQVAGLPEQKQRESARGLSQTKQP